MQLKAKVSATPGEGFKGLRTRWGCATRGKGSRNPRRRFAQPKAKVGLKAKVGVLQLEGRVSCCTSAASNVLRCDGLASAYSCCKCEHPLTQRNGVCSCAVCTPTRKRVRETLEFPYSFVKLLHVVQTCIKIYQNWDVSHKIC